MIESLEALEKLVLKTGIINDTCASLKKCIKCGKCKFEEPVETCDDYNLIITIKQDLERLELLENENQELKEEMETLKKYDMELFATTFKLKKAIEILSNYICVRNPLDEEDTYYLSALFSNEEIDKQTYDLLKEVLNND